MDNRKGSLIGSGQIGKQKPESGSGGNRILKTWREPRNWPGLEQQPQTGAPIRDGASSRG